MGAGVSPDGVSVPWALSARAVALFGATSAGRDRRARTVRRAGGWPGRSPRARRRRARRRRETRTRATSTRLSAYVTVAVLAAGGAAGALGPDQPATGAGLERQVHAGTQLHVVDVAAVAAHVLAVGDALAQAPQQSPVLGTQRVDQGHRLLRGWGPTGWLAWRRSATSCAAGGGGRRTASCVERVWGDGPAGPVRGRGGRQGRGVAGREQARRGVGMPARVVPLAAARF